MNQAHSEIGRRRQRDIPVAGGVACESAMAPNRAAFERWRSVPRVLRDVERRDRAIGLFGPRQPSPLLLAPIGALELVHKGWMWPEGLRGGDTNSLSPSAGEGNTPSRQQT